MTDTLYRVLCMQCGPLLYGEHLVGLETAAKIQAIHTNLTAHRVVLTPTKEDT